MKSSILGLILSLFMLPLLGQNNGNDLCVSDYYSISFSHIIGGKATIKINNTTKKIENLNNIPLSNDFQAGRNRITIQLYCEPGEMTGLGREVKPWKIEYHIMKNGVITGSVSKNGKSSKGGNVFLRRHEINSDIPDGIREISSGHPNYPFKGISFKGHRTPNEIAPCIDNAFATNFFTTPWNGPFYIYVASGPVLGEEILIEDVNTNGRKCYWSSAKLSSPKPIIRDKSLYVWDALPILQDKIRISTTRGSTQYEFHVCKIDENTYKLRSKNHSTRTRLVLYIYKK